VPIWTVSRNGGHKFIVYRSDDQPKTPYLIFQSLAVCLDDVPRVSTFQPIYLSFYDIYNQRHCHMCQGLVRDGPQPSTFRVERRPMTATSDTIVGSLPTMPNGPPKITGALPLYVLLNYTKSVMRSKRCRMLYQCYQPWPPAIVLQLEVSHCTL